MIKSWRFRLALFLVLILAGIWIVPASRWGIIGYLGNENFYEGRPTSYWNSQILTYLVRSARGNPVTFWDRIMAFIGIPPRPSPQIQPMKPSVLEGNPATIPVLI